MKYSDILRELFRLGHFRNPGNINGASWNVQEHDLDNLSAGSPEVREAIQSYQQFMILGLEPFSLMIHGRPACPDGIVGPATEALLQEPRCGAPDFYVEGMEEHYAIGSGSWPANCLPDWNNTHAITININSSGMQPWLTEVFESKVWPAVVDSFREIGLMLVRKDGDKKANLQTSFVVPDGGWIGLAIVPGSTSCSMSIWNRFDRAYKPANIAREWTTLVKHELGHNLRLNHTSGGVMNPSIVQGLPVTWKGVGDPSEPYLRKYFGGEPVDVGPPTSKTWSHQGYKDIKTPGAEVWVELRPPIPR